MGELLIVDYKFRWERDKSSAGQGEGDKAGQLGQHLPHLLLLHLVALQLEVGEGGEAWGEGGGKVLHKLVPLQTEGVEVRCSTEGARFDV